MSRLRAYQIQTRDQCYAEFARGAKGVIAVLPTGSGKTVIMGDMARNYPGHGCAIAHRSELVGQISRALNKECVPHNLMVPAAVVRTICGEHIEDTGRSYYNQRANWMVASVDTLNRRDASEPWYKQVGFVLGDEGHHFLKENKWGRAVSKFPNARVALFSASPERADGKGLGSHHDGIVDAMVVGPDMRWMIDQGMLTNYQIRGIHPSDLDISGVGISDTTGDYNLDQLRDAVKKSNSIVGDVVETYLRYAKGLLGITFAVDIEHANTIAAEFNRRGVSAEVVHAETSEEDRRKVLRRFKNKETLQLINVDLFGEGFDLPAIQCCSFARPTASYPLYVQQFGRALRLMISDILQAAWDTFTAEQRKQHIAESVKPFAYIFDHVGNVIAHNGPPDLRHKPWSLDRRDRKSRVTDDLIKVRLCLNTMCNQYYERIHPACPYCGTEPEPPKDRSKPANVDGDVYLYDAELLAKLFGDRDKLDSSFVPIFAGATPIQAAACRKRHAENQEAQRELRQLMGVYMPPNIDTRTNDRRFFHAFGIDSLTAQTLNAREARELHAKINERISSR